MITQLIIKNLAIVENLKLDFKDKMTIITGETGAGKSIILSSINLLLGGKASQDIIRKGALKADVIGTFNIKELISIKEYLIERGFLDPEEEECILRRTLNKEGKSVCYINDLRVSSKEMKNIGEQLINIHGQHANQELLKNKKQLELLDDYLCEEELISEVKDSYKIWKDLKEKLYELKTNFDDNHAKKQLLNYQYKELEELNLEEGEVPELEKELKQLESANNILICGGNAMNLITNDSSGGILSSMQETINLIESINENREELNEVLELLNTAQIEIEESRSSLEDYLENVEINPEKLSHIEDRLNKIYSLSKKHFEEPENLFFFKETIKEELNSLENHNEDLEEIEEKLLFAKNNYIQVAELLHSKREKTIKIFTKEINNELLKLNLEKDIFRVHINKKEVSEKNFSEHGFSEISFKIRPNLGEDEKLLSETASGGELSRISLAIQVIALKNKKIPTMIFDEIDTGISGETANIVGELLSALSDSGQVFCITHLPQVASKGTQHCYVSKATKNGKTYTEIEELSEDDRIKELAQMIGGNNLTKESWEHAKQLLHKG